MLDLKVKTFILNPGIAQSTHIIYRLNNQKKNDISSVTSYFNLLEGFFGKHSSFRMVDIDTVGDRF